MINNETKPPKGSLREMLEQMRKQGHLSNYTDEDWETVRTNPIINMSAWDQKRITWKCDLIDLKRRLK